MYSRRKTQTSSRLRRTQSSSSSYSNSIRFDQSRHVDAAIAHLHALKAAEIAFDRSSCTERSRARPDKENIHPVSLGRQQSVRYTGPGASPLLKKSITRRHAKGWTDVQFGDTCGTAEFDVPGYSPLPQRRYLSGRTGKGPVVSSSSASSFRLRKTTSLLSLFGGRDPNSAQQRSEIDHYVLQNSTSTRSVSSSPSIPFTPHTLRQKHLFSTGDSSHDRILARAAEEYIRSLNLQSSSEGNRLSERRAYIPSKPFLRTVRTTSTTRFGPAISSQPLSEAQPAMFGKIREFFKKKLKRKSKPLQISRHGHNGGDEIPEQQVSAQRPHYQLEPDTDQSASSRPLPLPDEWHSTRTDLTLHPQAQSSRNTVNPDYQLTTADPEVSDLPARDRSDCVRDADSCRQDCQSVERRDFAGVPYRNASGTSTWEGTVSSGVGEEAGSSTNDNRLSTILEDQVYRSRKGRPPFGRRGLGFHLFEEPLPNADVVADPERVASALRRHNQDQGQEENTQRPLEYNGVSPRQQGGGSAPFNTPPSVRRTHGTPTCGTPTSTNSEVSESQYSRDINGLRFSGRSLQDIQIEIERQAFSSHDSGHRAPPSEYVAMQQGIQRLRQELEAQESRARDAIQRERQARGGEMGDELEEYVLQYRSTGHGANFQPVLTVLARGSPGETSAPPTATSEHGSASTPSHEQARQLDYEAEYVPEWQPEVIAPSPSFAAKPAATTVDPGDPFTTMSSSEHARAAEGQLLHQRQPLRQAAVHTSEHKPEGSASRPSSSARPAATTIDPEDVFTTTSSSEHARAAEVFLRQRQPDRQAEGRTPEYQAEMTVSGPPSLARPTAFMVDPTDIFETPPSSEPVSNAESPLPPHHQPSRQVARHAPEHQPVVTSPFPSPRARRAARAHLPAHQSAWLLARTLWSDDDGANNETGDDNGAGNDTGNDHGADTDTANDREADNFDWEVTENAEFNSRASSPTLGYYDWPVRSSSFNSPLAGTTASGDESSPDMISAEASRREASNYGQNRDSETRGTPHRRHGHRRNRGGTIDEVESRKIWESQH